MKITTRTMIATETPEIKIEHLGEHVSFNVSAFGRTSFQKFDVFEQISAYWDTLSEKKQMDIFNIYKDIYNTFTNIYNRNELTDALTNKVAELMALHSLEEIENWLTYKYHLVIPPRFKNVYEHSIDNNTTRNKTYTSKDYIKLISLSIAIRTMIPIWGEYISLTRKESGTYFKEYYSFELLSKSSLYTSEPMEKLKIYIDSIIGNQKDNAVNILNSISSEDYTHWMLALVTIRRLCISDVRGLDPNANPVTFIYMYIYTMLKMDGDSERGMVRSKKDDNKPASDSEDKISTMEKYKIKSNISLGEIIELEFSMKNYQNVAMKLSSMIDEAVLENAMESSKLLLNQKILDPQMTLLRWIFKPVISPTGILYLSKPTIVRALGILQAVLWTRGHKYLALLATSHIIVSDSVMKIAPIDSIKRIDEASAERLNELYPYVRTIQSKKNDPTIINQAVRSIDSLTDQLTMYSWRPTADESLIKEVFGTTSRMLPIKPTIKTELAKLVIQVAERSWI